MFFCKNYLKFIYITISKFMRTFLSRKLIILKNIYNIIIFLFIYFKIHIGEIWSRFHLTSQHLFSSYKNQMVSFHKIPKSKYFLNCLILLFADRWYCGDFQYNIIKCLTISTVHYMFINTISSYSTKADQSYFFTFQSYQDQF